MSLLMAVFGTIVEGGKELLDKVIMVTPPPFLSFAVAEDGRLPFLSLTIVLMMRGWIGGSRWVELWVGWVWFQLLRLG